MLIQFEVENFGSIDSRQRLSLVASNYYRDGECVVEPNLPGLSGVRLLRGAALYGPNASGKSMLIKAMGMLKAVVVGVRGPEEPLPNYPFCLNALRVEEPTRFFVAFVQSGVRYEYDLQYLPRRVLFESLSAFPHGRAQLWFSRKWDNDANEYVWARPPGNLRGGAQLTKMVRENALTLSVGAQLNNPQLTEVHRWFAVSLQLLDLSAESVLPMQPGFSAQLLQNRSALSSRLVDLVRQADLGVVGVSVEPVDLSQLEQVPQMVRAQMAAAGAGWVRITFDHRGDSEGKDVVPIDSSGESAGTRRLFTLGGPWLDILENGHTAFVDELDTSLHPLLVRELLHLMFSPETNPKGAQVIFTTHNPYLLSGSTLRRDQVWFTEKDPSGGTHLYPLSDYGPRSTESIVNGYLAGRYGALPMIPAGLGL